MHINNDNTNVTFQMGMYYTFNLKNKIMQTILTDFYTLTSYDKAEDGKFTAHIHLNKHHDIFKGHFPEIR